MAGRDARELTVTAVLEEVERVRGFLRAYLSDLALAEEDILPIELSLHEICVNIAMYAYPQVPAGHMSVRLWRDDGTIYLEIRDRGAPFDPASKPDPDLLAKVRRGQGGGLGVYFFKTLMDGYTYRRDAGENILTIFKKLPAGPAGDQ